MDIMNVTVRFDEAQLKELVEEASERIRNDMCADCPYKESEEE